MQSITGFAGSRVFVGKHTTVKVMVFNEIYSQNSFLEEFLNNNIVQKYNISPQFYGGSVCNSHGMLFFETYGQSLNVVSDLPPLDTLLDQLDQIQTVLNDLEWHYHDTSLANLLISNGIIKLIDFQRITMSRIDTHFAAKYMERLKII
jgi:hypothetical protein